MDHSTQVLEAAVWAAVEGIATADQQSMLDADPRAWLRTLEVLLDETEDNLDAVRQLTGPERDQAVADLESELSRLEAAYDLLTSAADPTSVTVVADPPGEVRLQASWLRSRTKKKTDSGQIVVWAAGPATAPASEQQLNERLTAIGGPKLGWAPHRPVPLPNGTRAAALSIPVEEALGWLVAVGGGLGSDGIGTSVAWLGRVAVDAVRLVSRGNVVPTLKGD
jgi:hypothetical protein